MEQHKQNWGLKQGDTAPLLERTNKQFWKVEHDLGSTPAYQQTAQDHGERSHVVTSRRPRKKETKQSNKTTRLSKFYSVARERHQSHDRGK